MRLPLSFFRTRKTGDIISRVREMDQIRDFLTGSSLTLVVDILFSGIFIAIMFSYAAKLTWIVIATLVVYVAVWVAISPLFRKRVQNEFSDLEKNTGFLTESITGIQSIKASGTEYLFVDRWKKYLAAYSNSSFASKRLGVWVGQIIAMVQKVGAAVILYFGVQLVIDGDLSMGQLIAFNMFAGHVTMPILRLAQQWQDFQHTLISISRVGDIMNHPAEPVASAGRAGLADIEGGIAFHQVSFRYQSDGPDVLRKFDLTIKPGEVVGITGSSGSGKSTLTKLVQRLYVPQTGQVFVDGMDLALLDPDLLRRHIGVVLQESQLFNTTIRENLLLNQPDASEEQLQLALTLAGAAPVIEQLPQGLDTPTGENGSSLSGGQRQRIAIARALISDPKILIFDEATSALDYESEATIVRNMPKIVENRTAILIAHRLNSLRCCDRILVLEKGQVVEEGTHEQLLALNGHYHHLWTLQTL